MFFVLRTHLHYNSLILVATIYNETRTGKYESSFFKLDLPPIKLNCYISLNFHPRKVYILHLFFVSRADILSILSLKNSKEGKKYKHSLRTNKIFVNYRSTLKLPIYRLVDTIQCKTKWRLEYARTNQSS